MSLMNCCPHPGTVVDPSDTLIERTFATGDRPGYSGKIQPDNRVGVERGVVVLVDINLLPEKGEETSALLMAALAILGAAVLFWVALFYTFEQPFKRDSDLGTASAHPLQESQEAIRSDIHLSESGDSKKLLALTVDWAEAYQFDTVPLLHDLIRLLRNAVFCKPLILRVPISRQSSSNSTRKRMRPIILQDCKQRLPFQQFPSSP